MTIQWPQSRGTHGQPSSTATKPTQSVECDHVYVLQHQPAAAAAARRVTRRVLDAWGCVGETMEDVLLVVSELVTNAVEHARPTPALRLRSVSVDGQAAVRVEVTDGGPLTRRPRWTGPGQMDEHGRGSVIVSCLAARSGHVESGSGTTYWAELTVA